MFKKGIKNPRKQKDHLVGAVHECAGVFMNHNQFHLIFSFYLALLVLEGSSSKKLGLIDGWDKHRISN